MSPKVPLISSILSPDTSSRKYLCLIGELPSLFQDKGHASERGKQSPLCPTYPFHFLCFGHPSPPAVFQTLTFEYLWASDSQGLECPSFPYILKKNPTTLTILFFPPQLPGDMGSSALR